MPAERVVLVVEIDDARNLPAIIRAIGAAPGLRVTAHVRGAAEQIMAAVREMGLDVSPGGR